MKNLLTTLGAFIFLLIPAISLAATTFHYTCSNMSVFGSITCGTDTWIYPNSTASGQYDYPPAFNLVPGTWYVSFDYSGTGQLNYGSSGNSLDDVTAFVTGSGSLHDSLISINGANTSAGLLLRNDIGGSRFIGDVSNVCVTDTPGGCTAPPPTPTGGTLADEIAAAQSGMASTTGFNIGAVITWSGDNLLKVFIGSGVAVLFELRYWIVAMVIISLIVLFAFRGMRFFKH